MATYYVRKTGNDTNAGTSAGTAWLTIDKAANTVAAGDTVYVGAGVYRELVTMDTSGTSGNLIKFIADITGAQTGDGGLVRITAHDSETAAAVRAYSLNMNTKQFIEWYDVVFSGGTTSTVGSTSLIELAYEDCVFDGCTFLQSDDEVDFCFNINLGDGATPTTSGLILRNCVFVGQAIISYDTNVTAHTNVKMLITNCLFIWSSTTNSYNLFIDSTLSNPFAVGGILIRNSLFIGAYFGVTMDAPKNTTNPIEIHNCTSLNQNRLINAGGAVAGAVLEDYNQVLSGGVATGTPVTSGGNSDITISSPLMVGGIADLALYRRLGWSPYKPWEPIADSAMIGSASATYAPDTDMYGNPRPMGRNTDDTGPVEANTQPIQNSTDEYEGTYCMELSGAGHYQFWQPVEAAATSISVRAKYDSNYTGTNPQLVVTNIPGVADQTDTVAGGSGTYEQLTCSFTPTSAGFVRVKLVSNDTSSNGKCFFDDIQVS